MGGGDDDRWATGIARGMADCPLTCLCILFISFARRPPRKQTTRCCRRDGTPSTRHRSRSAVVASSLNFCISAFNCGDLSELNSDFPGLTRRRSSSIEWILGGCLLLCSLGSNSPMALYELNNCRNRIGGGRSGGDWPTATLPFTDYFTMHR